MPMQHDTPWRGLAVVANNYKPRTHKSSNAQLVTNYAFLQISEIASRREVT